MKNRIYIYMSDIFRFFLCGDKREIYNPRNGTMTYAPINGAKVKRYNKNGKEITNIMFNFKIPFFDEINAFFVREKKIDDNYVEQEIGEIEGISRKRAKKIRNELAKSSSVPEAENLLTVIKNNNNCLTLGESERSARLSTRRRSLLSSPIRGLLRSQSA